MANKLQGIGRQNPFSLRLPPSLRLRLEVQAERGNRSLNAHINLLLERSLSENPIVTVTGGVEEPLSRHPYGVRMPEALKERLQAAANESGCPLNTELIMRLDLAERAADKGGIVERPAENLSHRPEITAAWLRLSRAIDVMLSASALDLSKAAVELRAAKAAYERQSSIGSLVSLASVEVQSHKPE
ncbi:hypothetical protein [Pseudomonas sp. EMN2]|uniref:hypothetical protein n=1 Tax=Pseudomonas sp. EMN2 TaxID=2615212 RepID=UPI00129A517E|nr:hypothetical protein [Pseudomonas sp. EMN2]